MTVIALTLAALPLRAGIIGAAEKDRFRLPSGRAEVDQAIACFQRRDYEQAFQLLKAAADKDPDLFPARLMFAKLYFLNGQVAEGRAADSRQAAHPHAKVVGRLGNRPGLTCTEGRWQRVRRAVCRW